MKSSKKILLDEYDDGKYRAALHGSHQERDYDWAATENYIKLDRDRKLRLSQCRIDLRSEYGKMVKEEIEKRHG